MDLTVATDKLVAISALAWYWQILVGEKIQYLAGMWNKHLTGQLAWKPYINRKGKTVKPNTNLQKKWRAPSWSWACMDGLIDMPNLKCYEDEGNLLTVLGAKMEFLTDDIFGKVTVGILTLCGRISTVAVRSNIRDTPDSEERYRPDYVVALEWDCCVGTNSKVYPNLTYLEHAWVEGLSRILYLLPVRTIPSYPGHEWYPEYMVDTLILQRQPDTKDVFIRWGLCEMPKSVYEGIFEEAFQDFDLSAEESGLDHERYKDGIMRYTVHLV